MTSELRNAWGIERQMTVEMTLEVFASFAEKMYIAHDECEQSQEERGTRAGLEMSNVRETNAGVRATQVSLNALSPRAACPSDLVAKVFPPIKINGVSGRRDWNRF